MSDAPPRRRRRARTRLLTRLLATSLTIAVAAVVATAWLATRTTSDRIVGEFTRSLEADGFIYSQLTSYAATHPSWDEVGPLVTELAERTGRRIALTTVDGDLLADSATLDGRPEVPLPTVPAALVDPIAPLLDVAGTTTPPLIDALAPPSPAGDDAAWLPGVGHLSCLSEMGAITITMDVVTRAVVVVGQVVPDGALLRCGADGLDLRTDEQRRLQRELAETLAGCLQVRDVPYATAVGQLADALFGATSRTHLRQYITSLDEDTELVLVPDLSATAWVAPVQPGGLAGEDATVRVTPLPADDAQARIAAECDEQARREVLAPHLAAPALLHLDWLEEPTGLLAAGSGPTLAAVALVLTIAVGATVLAGRRLVTPLVALTDAAQRLEAGDHGSRVVVRSRDEVGRLASAFNAMAETLQDTEVQRRAMVGDVAHELRSPLTNLRAHLEAAQDGVVEVDDALVASLLDESLLLQRLVDDLQQLALADAGQLRLHAEDTDASEVAAQLVQAHRAAALAAGVDLVVDADAPVPVMADRARLRQALGNLVGNALRYTPAGGIVTVRVRTGGDEVVVTVTDTGPGIAPEHLPRLFDRFSRVDASRSRATGGSGLGLAITRTLVEAHGGSVTAESAPGRGAAFTVRLPARGPDVHGPTVHGVSDTTPDLRS